MRSSLLIPACLLLAFGAAACGGQRANTPPPPPSAAASILARDAPRCHQLRAIRDLYYASPRIRLDTTRAVDPWRGIVRDSAWALTRLDARGAAIVDDWTHPILYWTAASPDSIRIVISTGFSGSTLVVGAASASGDTLRGRAAAFHDVGPTENDAGPVTLVRVPCVTAG